jgi:hypothetical protein
MVRGLTFRAKSGVSRVKREFRVLPLRDLAERAKVEENAQRALSSYRAIEDAGGWPEIRYYDRHGWRIVDLRKESPTG